MDEGSMSIFGAIQIADDLEEAVLDTLEKWFYTYMVEYELQRHLIPDRNTRPTHPMPRSYLKVNQLDKEAADQLPSIVCVSPGLSNRHPPMQEGDGSFRAFFNVGVGVFCTAKDRKDTMKICRMYTGIARTIMLQQQSLGGFADGSVWLDESYDPHFTFTDDQTISAGQVLFEIEVAGVINRFDGPKTIDPLPEQPGSDWPLAEEVIATVEILED